MKKLFISNKDESVRLFKSDLLEKFTHVHYLTPVVVFGPVVLYFLYQSFLHQSLGLLAGLGMFAVGVIAWSFTEYFLHRFVFHYHPKSKLGQRIHFLLHGVHHDYPNDSNRLVMAPLISIPLAFAFYYGFKMVMPIHLLFPYFSGFVAGYIFYDTLHYALHHIEFKNKIWIALKTHHLKHHFKDPEKGYGVSSPVWDVIVGSNFIKKEKKAQVGNQESSRSRAV